MTEQMNNGVETTVQDAPAEVTETTETAQETPKATTPARKRQNAKERKGKATTGIRTARKTRPAKVAKAVSTIRKSTTMSLAERDAIICKKYKHVIPGTMQFNKDHNRYTVKIKCQFKGCTDTRRVATSDLFQVKYCEHHHNEARLAARRKANGSNKKKVKKAA